MPNGKGGNGNDAQNESSELAKGRMHESNDGCTSLRKRRVKEADKAKNGGIVFASKMDGMAANEERRIRSRVLESEKEVGKG